MTTYVRMWECRFCHNHYTTDDADAIDIARDSMRAAIVHQVIRDHIRTKHPKVWPLWKRVLDEIKVLQGFAAVGVR